MQLGITGLDLGKGQQVIVKGSKRVTDDLPQFYAAFFRWGITNSISYLQNALRKNRLAGLGLIYIQNTV